MNCNCFPLIDQFERECRVKFKAIQNENQRVELRDKWKKEKRLSVSGSKSERRYFREKYIETEVGRRFRQDIGKSNLANVSSIWLVFHRRCLPGHASRVSRWETASSCGCIFNQYSAISIRSFSLFLFSQLSRWLRN